MLNLPYAECTGCTACAQICPVGAISMEADKEGFLRSTVHHDKCVNCGKCEKSCPLLTHRDPNGVPQYGVFAAKIKDEAVHRRSQSGGVFYALGCYILQQGGVVYGAALNEIFETEHIRVDTPSELSRLQGVKYVQSRLGDVFFQVGKDLKNGICVLFSGTPCQVSGLKSYLREKRIDDNLLLTVDLVCYGVPSPGVFRDWVRCLEKVYGCRVTQVIYRRTDTKWGKGKELYRLTDGAVLEGDYYTKWYFRNLIIRPSCESCQFCNTNRPGDITLGDFWGVDKALPDFFDDRGVSLVMCATERGKQAFRAVEQKLEIRESRLEDAVAAQPRLQNIPVKPSSYRQRFWELYRRKGLAYLAMEEGFISPGIIFRAEKKLSSIARKFRR